LIFCFLPVARAQKVAIGEYPLPAGDLWAITAGPDDALWFSEGQAIGRITTAGVFTEYGLPNCNCEPVGITVGSDGALWFTDEIGQIGRITTEGVLTEYLVPTAPSGLRLITSGPDGALWFTESVSNQIGRITTAGVFTEYALPSRPSGSFPYAITAGPDGALWFTEISSNKIGRITTAGAITEYAVPTANSAPDSIVAGPDGAMWFTEFNGGKIGRITTTGVITEYSVPTVNFGPEAITVGPDGTLWFTETGGKIGEVVFPTANLSVDPVNGAYRSNLTFTGSAFAPNEKVQIYVQGVGSAVLASATADAAGAFIVRARAPQSPYAPRLFLGVGQSSGKLGAAKFSVTPRLILSPNVGPVGSTTVAQGYGFGTREKVDVYWYSPRLLLGTVTADIYGTFKGSAAFSFTVPEGAPLGPNKIIGKGEFTNAIGRAPFSVE
jgi:virginiamycin B lyase